MKTALTVALAMVLLGAAPGGCGGKEDPPPPYVCADPCPGATVVATLSNGQLWCFIQVGPAPKACSFAMTPPKTPEECVATQDYWTANYPSYCW